MKKLFKEKKNNKRKGFTLIELLAVIVILAIVLVVTIPSVISSMKSAKEKQFENAKLSVKDWFEKQAGMSKLGEEYTSQEFRDYLDEVCNTVLDTEKSECRKLNTYTPLTDSVIEAAGLDSDDIYLDYSYVVFSDDGKADVKLVPTPTGKFTSSNDDNNANILDLTKRQGIEFDKRINSWDERSLSTSKYYYSVHWEGFTPNKNEPDRKIKNLSIGKDSVAFDSAYGYGVIIPFKYNKNYTYIIEYTINSKTYIGYTMYNKYGQANETNTTPTWGTSCGNIRVSGQKEMQDLGNGKKRYRSVLSTNKDNQLVIDEKVIINGNVDFNDGYIAISVLPTNHASYFGTETVHTCAEDIIITIK